MLRGGCERHRGVKNYTRDAIYWDYWEKKTVGTEYFGVGNQELRL